MTVDIEPFLSIGLSEQKANETIKNANLTKFLLDVIEQAKLIEPDLSKWSPSAGTLLYHIATRLKAQSRQHLALLITHCVNGGIKNDTQFSAALDYLLHHSVTGFEEKEFETACGIGADVSPDELEETVKEVVAKYQSNLISERYQFNTAKLMADVKSLLKWSDGKIVKSEVDLQILDLLGPKTADDLEAACKPKTKKEKTKPVTGNESQPKANKHKDTATSEEPINDGAATISELMRNKVHFHTPGENFKTEGYVITPKTQEIIKKHLAETGGKVITRFPPEPNGILHIGHAKAININFGYAKAYGGDCYLRYDDTNPEKEEERFFKGIHDMVTWLGYTPYEITHASDRFDRLFELAIDLVKRNHAYVCHQKQEEIKGFNPPPSPWRERPIEESLQLFMDMKHGKFEEGEATLRMKTTLEEGKQDPVAYRIKYCTHHRTGDKWCIYPTYDYTHCLCDSIENITHSLCTKEFQSRRSSYYWLCNALDLYCPVQWEYGRLNVNYTVVSKRKIQKLITEGFVRDWDDPRLFTLTALRRRGFPAEAINSFVAKLGLTMAQIFVDPQMIEASVRDFLNVNAPRAMAVLEPLKLNIVNLPSDSPKEVEVLNFPTDSSKGSHKVPFNATVYIEQSDFRETAEKNFKRLTTGQAVGLKYVGFVLTVKKIHKGKNDNIDMVDVECSPVDDQNKPKAFIQWVSDPVTCEVRLYERLFNHKCPEDAAQVPGGYLTDINQDSLKMIPNALVDRSVTGAKVYDKFQFERIGYFSIDPDMENSGKLIFNRTVLLKEDAGKK